MAGQDRVRFAALTVFAILACCPALAADPASPQSEIERLRAELAVTQARIDVLEAKFAGLSASAAATREALAKDLAQPMLLLVGEGPCPAGFDRIKVEAMLLTGPRTPKNTELIDAAGLGDDEQMGVGARVYRYMDMCYRAAGAVSLK